MTDKFESVIEALGIIQVWYECPSPWARRKLDEIIFKLKQEKEK
jgi:hypothetical protein